MTTTTTTTTTYAPASTSPFAAMKRVPREALARQAIRAEAHRRLAGLGRCKPLGQADLERLAGEVLRKLNLNTSHLGFAMVEVANAFWRDQFAALPFDRRVLLLPHCLRSAADCRGTYSALGLDCAGCGACALSKLKDEAESLGYNVLIAEGTPAVVQIALSGRADGLLGVACLDSLEKAFDRVAQLGVPHVAVALLCDGCTGTSVEVDMVRHWMRLRAKPAAARTRTYLPLLRKARDLLEPEEFDVLLADAAASTELSHDNALEATEAIGLDWLRKGGKRFRPFVTLASYSALVSGHDALEPDADLTELFPISVKRVALAMEVMHKASLVHDDVEDDDAFRYGEETLHRRYGVANAVNIGDYLIGLGYQLVSSIQDELGADCAADILRRLSEAHLRLCRGQGAELMLYNQCLCQLDALEIMRIYALKTAPAFEVSLSAGIRMAHAAHLSDEIVRAFSRSVGVAYQVQNDLQDWEADGNNKLLAGQDVRSGRRTVLLAFALDGCAGHAKNRLIDLVESQSHDPDSLQQMRDLFEATGAFGKARQLVDKYRTRAKGLADEVEPDIMGDLMRFIADVLLGA